MVESGSGSRTAIKHPIGIENSTTGHDTGEIARPQFAEGRPRCHDGERIDTLGRGQRARCTLRPRMVGGGDRNHHRTVDLEPPRRERRDQREGGRFFVEWVFSL
jgi:hypothetical protein